MRRKAHNFLRKQRIPLGYFALHESREEIFYSCLFVMNHAERFPAELLSFFRALHRRILHRRASLRVALRLDEKSNLNSFMQEPGAVCDNQSKESSDV